MAWVEARGERCVYCGDRASTDEHFPPRSVATAGWLLSACGECNQFANTEHPADLDARAAYVKAKLRARYRAVLAYAVFDEFDVASFSGALLREVQACVRAKERAQRRLAWSVDWYFEAIGQPKPFAGPSAASPGTTDSGSGTPRSDAGRGRTRHAIECASCGAAFNAVRATAKWCHTCKDRPAFRRAVQALFA